MAVKLRIADHIANNIRHNDEIAKVTGLGNWSDEEIIRVIRSGVDRTGRQHLSVMPWPAYTRISDDDAIAIVVYLRSLPPVEHHVPENVRPGEETTAPYIHFGAYRKMK